MKTYFYTPFFLFLLSLSPSFSVPFIHEHRPSEKESKSLILSFSSFFLQATLCCWCCCLQRVCLCIRKNEIDIKNEINRHRLQLLIVFCDFQMYISMTISPQFKEYNLCWQNINYFNYIKVVYIVYFFFFTINHCLKLTVFIQGNSTINPWI